MAVPKLTGPVQGADYATKERTGPWCLDHKSVYCAHAQEFIDKRIDVADIERAILNEASPGVIHMTVPIFPTYAVWELLYYEVHMHDVIGPIGVMHENDMRNRQDVASIRRLVPGESARDLGMTLRQQFEDELEDWIDKLIQPRGGPPPWMNCKSPGHSFRYQQVASKVVAPDNIKAAHSGSGDVEIVYGMLYCYLRHGRCLFCYVNETSRDAVRVNPNLTSGVIFPANAPNTSDFDDLVPR